MNTKAIAALEESITHWQRIIENIAAGTPFARDQPISEECALCEAFDRPHQLQSCEGCPVFEHTGETHCDTTPYGDAYRAWTKADEGEVAMQRAAAEAYKEMAFLRSLHPTWRS